MYCKSSTEKPNYPVRCRVAIKSIDYYQSDTFKFSASVLRAAIALLRTKMGNV